MFAVPVLTHDPSFMSHTDMEYLKRIRMALLFILEPLMIKNGNYSFGFYKVSSLFHCISCLYFWFFDPEDEKPQGCI